MLSTSAIFFYFSEKFSSQKLKNPKAGFSLRTAVSLSAKYNLAEVLDFEAAKVVKKSLGYSRQKGTGSLHIFYSALVNNPKLDILFSRLLLDAEEIKASLEKAMENYFSYSRDKLFDESFENIILEALKTAGEKRHLKIKMWDLISALCKKDKNFQEILILHKYKPEDIEDLVLLFSGNEEKIIGQKKFWEYENLVKRGTLVKDWTAAYTITLDRYQTDLTKNINENITDVLKNRPEVSAMERILAKPQNNNVLLVGDPGKAKKSLVHALAHKSRQGQSLAAVNYKRFVELNMQLLLAESASSEEFEKTLDAIMREVVFSGNVVLAINDFHNYIGQEKEKAGVVDISGVISHFLQLPNFQFIGITNYDGLKRHIEKNSVFSFFEKVEATGVTDKETFFILGNMVQNYEAKYGIFIPYPSIKEIISLADRYMPNSPFPDKAIDVLNQAIAYLSSLKKGKVILPEHIIKIISEKTQIPVGQAAEKEKKVLLNLEELIHKKIVNQEEAVKEISSALKRARADISIRKGPMGAFLFLGPTGVGKTETSKALAEIYFGSQSKMIRLDMSEFQQIKDISRLIGSEELEEPGLLTSQVNESPFSLVLLDEFEKAHPNILNLFLQVFDEGYLTDGLSRKIDFRNTILIATSNAGYQIILEAVKNNEEWGNVKEKMLDYLFKEGNFRPELINRFDSVVIFRALTKKNLLDIAQLLLENLKRNLLGKGVEFEITEDLKEKIVELGYNPIFGAREMRRVIQEKIENVLAEALLSEKIKEGDRIKINPESFEIIPS